MSEIQLFSPLSPLECEDRLRAAIDGPGLHTLFGGKPVVGFVVGTTVELRKRVLFRHQFQTTLYGTLEQTGGGTLFRGDNRIGHFAWDHRNLWGWLIVGLAFLVMGIILTDQYMIGLIFIPFIIMLAGMSFFGQWLARDEEAYLVEFVSRVIQSKPVDS